MPRSLIATLFLVPILLTGCGGGSPSTSDTSAKTPATPKPAADGIPATVFASAAPEAAVPLIDAKTSAAAGERVVFEARIGGRSDPFVDGRAVFLVVDSSLLSCDQLHGDRCKRPWDYCCEPKGNLLKHMATVQVVGDDGRPLSYSLRDQHALAPLKTVVIAGTVAQVDDTGSFVVNAESIHVKES